MRKVTLRSWLNIRMITVSVLIVILKSSPQDSCYLSPNSVWAAGARLALAQKYHPTTITKASWTINIIILFDTSKLVPLDDPWHVVVTRNISSTSSSSVGPPSSITSYNTWQGHSYMHPAVWDKETAGLQWLQKFPARWWCSHHILATAKDI